MSIKKKRIGHGGIFAALCYSESMKKPVLFLDFDRTLFDTDRFYEWLGDEYSLRILALMAGEITPPDFASYLYPDTIDFLHEVKKSYRLVLLTYAINVALQHRKIADSGISQFMDDIIVTQREKWIDAKEYLARSGDPRSASGHVFIDDAPENIAGMMRENPSIRSIRIDRLPLEREKCSPSRFSPRACRHEPP